MSKQTPMRRLLEFVLFCPWPSPGFPMSYGKKKNKHMDEAVSGEHGGGGGGWAGPKGGTFNINAPGQEVLERTSCVIRTATADDHLSRGTIELRFTVALPARGRTILGREAHRILAGNLPLLIKQSVLWMNQDQQALIQHIRTIEDQEGLRSQLKPNGLVAFVANGSILPRASGASSLPMTGNGVVPFQSPSDLELELVTPNGGSVRGMGIPRGITVLSGGGFHGKSTLLEALELGVYNHISGDGRESVVTDPTAVKIRAEDGRNVSGVDISPLISGLPGGKDTSHYSSEDASGSTSMAANIQEALSLGCTALLIDEDSSATNLLVRDQRMQALIQNETITPLVSKVRALYAQHGVSTIIVIGGCGDYLSVADLVLVLSSYTPTNLTARASQIVQVYPTSLTEHASYGALPGHRTPTLPASLLSNRPPAARGKSFISLPAPHYGPKDPSASEPGVDISGLVQLVEAGQANLAAHVIRWLARRQSEGEPEGNRPLGEVLGEVGRLLEAEGLDAVQAADEGRLGGDLVFTRALELGGVLGRIRGTS
ncbi:MAG: hypothetical protein M1819_005340 [Sarea resinae]|nr:MAG: hypothetical protein M1819_005340 [Sarea resinae]